MSVQRSPERRGGAGRGMGVLAILAVILVLVVAVVFLTGLADPLLGVGDSSNGGQAGPPPAASTPTPETQMSTPTPTPLPTPTPGAEAEPTAVPLQTPAVDFGEVAAEGLVNLNLPSGEEVQAWYTVQVDTGTRNITLFFALYNEDDAMTSTVKVSEYTQGARPSNAEVTLFHPEGPKRVLVFDASNGTVTEAQELNFQPYSPSLFSPALRSSLVYYEVSLEDGPDATRVELDRDLTGVQARETIVFQKTDPEVVQRALVEIELLANQIEEKRR